MLYFLNCHKSEEAYAFKNVTSPIAYIGGPTYYYGIIIVDKITRTSPETRLIKDLVFKDRVLYNGDRWEPV